MLTAKLCLQRVNLAPLSKIDHVYVNDWKKTSILTKKCQIVEKAVYIIAATWLISAHMSLDSKTFGILLTIINSQLSILMQLCCAIQMAKGCIAITEILQRTVFSVLQSLLHICFPQNLVQQFAFLPFLQLCPLLNVQQWLLCRMSLSRLVDFT